jgi:outer membrane protein assembly factor BamB
VQKNIFRKILVFIIIILFIETNFVPSMIGDIGEKKENLLINKTKSTSSSTTDWWPMFHHDPQHSGYSTSDAPETNNTKWSYQTGDSIVVSSAIFDGKIYFGSYDHNLYCLDAETGNKIWNYTTGDRIQCDPAIAYGKVYVGSDDCNMYCLDADTGNKIWNYTTGDSIWYSTVVDGKVYFGSLDNNVYCLDAADGHLIWTYVTGSNVRSGPAVADGKLYVGSNDASVYCLNAKNGSLIWKYSSEHLWIETSPAVANGNVYVNTDYYRMGCLNADNGSKIWTYLTNYVLFSSPGVAYGKVYFGGLDYVHCLDANTGGEIWIYSTNGFVNPSPAIADGKVYLGCNDYNVFCLNADNGSEIWRYKTGDRVVSSPAIANGKLYIGSIDGKMYCFGDEGVNHHPDVPTIKGPLNGHVRTDYIYTANSSDPDCDNVSYFFNWGDGTNSGWTEPIPSGIEISRNHSWQLGGIYYIKVKAKDEYNMESEWATFDVTIPRNRVSYNSLFMRFLERFPILERLLQIQPHTTF